MEQVTATETAPETTPETAPEVARIEDLAERELSVCPSTATAPSSRRSSSPRILPNKPKPGAIQLLFAQDVASDWWLELQLLFGTYDRRDITEPS